MDGYPKPIASKMKKFYTNLSEKDKRHYAAIESLKLGHGGINYIADLFGISRETIRSGITDMEGELLADRVRDIGGGRKELSEKHPDLDDIFLKGNR